MHVDGQNVDHYLPNHYVNDYKHCESQDIPIESDQIFNWLLWQKNLLLVNDETIQEYNTGSEKSVCQIVETILIEW